MRPDPAARVLAVLAEHPRGALTRQEIAARTATPAAAVAETTTALEDQGRVVTVELPSVDRHLPAITVTAAVRDGNGDGIEDARTRAAAVAAAWQRQLMAAHRCH